MTSIQRQQLLYFATGSAMLPAMPERKDNDQGSKRSYLALKDKHRFYYVKDSVLRQCFIAIAVNSIFI